MASKALPTVTKCHTTTLQSHGCDLGSWQLVWTYDQLPSAPQSHDFHLQSSLPTFPENQWSNCCQLPKELPLISEAWLKELPANPCLLRSRQLKSKQAHSLKFFSPCLCELSTKAGREGPQGLCTPEFPSLHRDPNPSPPTSMPFCSWSSFCWEGISILHSQLRGLSSQRAACQRNLSHSWDVRIIVVEWSSYVDISHNDHFLNDWGSGPNMVLTWGLPEKA